MFKLSKDFWQKQKILITGGAGFLGSHIVEILKNECQVNDKNLEIPLFKDYDLRKREVCEKLVEDKTLVIHLAANVGGIGHITAHSAEVYYDNLIMGAELMEASRKASATKFVALGTTCAYPSGVSLPCKEDDLWNGFPDKETSSYGLAKRMLALQSQVYREQYNFNSIYLLPTNLYGPRDHFNATSSHVIAALIHKFYLAKKNNDLEVVVWGKGTATREFLYVKDAGYGILLASEHYNKSDPVNLGSGLETSIKQLVEILCSLFDFKGKIVWDASKPEGKKRLLLDVSRAKQEFGFEASTRLEDGLKETVRWYEEEGISFSAS